jgi:hypothetical protein
VGKF